MGLHYYGTQCNHWGPQQWPMLHESLLPCYIRVSYCWKGCWTHEICHGKGKGSLLNHNYKGRPHWGPHGLFQFSSQTHTELLISRLFIDHPSFGLQLEMMAVIKSISSIQFCHLYSSKNYKETSYYTSEQAAHLLGFSIGHANTTTSYHFLYK